MHNDVFHHLEIANQPYQLVNKVMTHAYCKVTTGYISHSHGQVLILYLQMLSGCKQMGIYMEFPQGHSWMS